ncbi:hypothetical protein AB0C28_10475 [Nonomuraea sp. NPDC048892]|uniref:hypothetical protein n=1 Tax=Nonomuraea sp. NPDC048892 TaxID=3154624 RepID=UPI0033E9E392
MKTSASAYLALISLATAAACSSPPHSPPDTRPLADVTATPHECNLISSSAIKMATGFQSYLAVGGKRDKGRFASCSVTDSTNATGALGLTIEVFEPSPISPEGLQNTKAITKGSDLPVQLGPGFAAWRRGSHNRTIASVYGWTSDYKRLLTVNIYKGAVGRNALADATEFFRQLKPILLDKQE